jgi:hypothetical protein
MELIFYKSAIRGKPPAELFHTFAGRENLPQMFFSFSRGAKNQKLIDLHFRGMRKTFF